MLRIYITGCRKPVGRGQFLMTHYGTEDCGLRNKPAQQSAEKLNVRCERAAARLGCSKRVKTGVLEHNRSSCELIWAIHGIKYVKYR